MGFAGTTTSFQIVMNTQKPPLKSSHQKNTCQIFLRKKIPESKISNPKNSSIILALEIRSTPPPAGAARTGKVRMLVPDDLPRKKGTVNSLPLTLLNSNFHFIPLCYTFGANQQ